MNYQKNYNDLIERAKKKKRNKKSDYFEIHHIVPKSLGGSNRKENLVLLTAREHFLAHYMLWKIYNNTEMACAFWALCGRTKEHVSSRQYEKLKKIISEETSKRFKNKKTHNSQTVKNLTTGEVFGSLRDACKSLKVSPRNASHLKKCALSGKKYKDCYWQIGEKEVEKVPQSKGVAKKVKCVETGIIYNSGKEALRSLNVPNKTNSILIKKAALNGNKAYGFHWEFLN